MSSSDDDDDIPNVVTRQDLLEEAAALTKSLYRTCFRSVKVIRWGNEFDDKEFERREEEFRNGTGSSGSSGILSMAPPPNKEDELRSRAEYYASYTREYFTQESDCLDNDPIQQRDIDRYLYYLKKGEKDRRWLLGDMMFVDPYKDVSKSRQPRIKRFETMSRRYLGIDMDDKNDKLTTKTKSMDQVTTSGSSEDKDNDGFIEDDLPEWWNRK